MAGLPIRRGIDLAALAAVVAILLGCALIGWSIGHRGTTEALALAESAKHEAQEAQDLTAAAIDEAEHWKRQSAETSKHAAELADDLAEATSTIEALESRVELLNRKVAKPTVRPMSYTKPSGWQTARVSWYGPGFYGNTMAGGGKLTKTSMVVAHRSMKFGTRIEFEYKGRRCVAVVRDRGPYVSGRTFDLGPGTAKTLGFSGVGTVRWRVL